MASKLILPIDKEFSAYKTKDGFIVSLFFCNPLALVSELNRGI